MALDAGIDVELPSTDCYGEPLLDAVRAGASAPRRSTWRSAACYGRSSSSDSSSSPFVDAAKRCGDRDTAAHRELAREIARKSLVLLRNDGTLPLAQDSGSRRRDRPVRRRRAQPLRRLRLPGPCRVVARTCCKSGQDAVRTAPSAGGTSDGGALEAPTVLDALRDRFGDARAFRAADATSRRNSRDGFDAAVALARRRPTSRSW